MISSSILNNLNFEYATELASNPLESQRVKNSDLPLAIEVASIGKAIQHIYSNHKGV